MLVKATSKYLPVKLDVSVALFPSEVLADVRPIPKKKIMQLFLEIAKIKSNQAAWKGVWGKEESMRETDKCRWRERVRRKGGCQIYDI